MAFLSALPINGEKPWGQEKLSIAVSELQSNALDKRGDTVIGAVSFSNATLASPTISGTVATGGAVSEAGGNLKLLKTTAIGDAVITGGLTTGGATLIKKTATNALDVQNDGGTTSVLRIDTIDNLAVIKGIVTSSFSNTVSIPSVDHTTHQAVFQFNLPSNGYFCGEIILSGISPGNNKELDYVIQVTNAWWALINQRAFKTVKHDGNRGIGYCKLLYKANPNTLLLVVRSSIPGSLNIGLHIHSSQYNVTSVESRSELNYDYITTGGYIEF